MSDIATRKIRRKRLPADVRAGHGTWTKYSTGCRCEGCAAACSEYGRARRAAKKAGIPFVPPAHLLASVRLPNPVIAERSEAELIFRRFTYRAEIAPSVMRRLSGAFGASRYVYNRYLELARSEYAAGQPHPTSIDGGREIVTKGRTNPDTLWLRDFPSGMLTASVREGATAYDNFFQSVTGKRKGPRVGFPRWKKRTHRQAVTFPKGTFSINGGHESTKGTGGRLWLSKVGYVQVHWHRELPAAPSSVKVIRESSGRYRVSFLVQILKPSQKGLTRQPRAAGVDLGLTDYAAIVYSDGTREKLPNPRYLRGAEQKLARLQRDLSRKQNGSRNRAKAREKVARAFERVRNQRLNHARQLVSKLIRENQSISIETLRVAGMVRDHRLAKAITDAGWAQFIQILEQQADLHGRNLFRADPFFPSTQRCSVCGEGTGKKPLRVREFDCPHCGSRLDRDFNAATNLLVAAGSAETVNACGREVRLQLAGALPGEARTHLKPHRRCGEKEAQHGRVPGRRHVNERRNTHAA